MRFYHSLLAVGLCFVTSLPGKADNEPRFLQPPTVSGGRVLRPNHWSLLTFEVVNRRDKAASVVTTTYFPHHANLQFGRQLWIPPQAKRRSWFPIQVPNLEDPETTQIEMYSLLIDRTTGDEKNIPSRDGVLHHRGLASVTRRLPATGIFEDIDDENPRHAIAAARVSRNQTVEVRDLQSGMVPPLDMILKNLDQLVVCTNHLQHDAAALQAVRRWLHRGGKMWIMLDKIDPATAQQLLGDQANWDVVDDVLLDHVQIIDEQPHRGKQDGVPRRFDDPIRMVRLLIEDAEVTYSVGGWPAAIWTRVGRGEVLLTTVEARGWYRRWTAEDKKPKDARQASSFAATVPLANIAERLMQIQNDPLPTKSAFREIAIAAIGHQILSRFHVSLMLGVFCLCLVASGSILAWRRLGAWMGWIGPALAIITTVIVGVAGSKTRHAIPSSCSVGQLIESNRPFRELRTSGELAMYNPLQWSGRLGGHGDGVLLPATAGETGTTSRMIWTDLDSWHWENVKLESGIQVASFTHTAITNEVVEATATFDRDGLVGSLTPGPLSRFADAMLVTKLGRAITVRSQDGRAFAASSAEVLAPGNYFTSAVVSEQQRRRQSVVASLLESKNWRLHSADLVMLAWVDPLPLPFDVNNPERQMGDALLKVPIQLRRPAAGVEVSIPTPLITYRSVQHRDGTISPAFSNVDRKWIGPLAMATQARIAVELPAEVLPLDVVRVTFFLRIRAPQRRLRLLADDDRDDSILAERRSPVGSLQISIDATDRIQLDDRGRLIFVVDIGEHPQESDGNISVVGWQIDDLSIQVEGVVQDIEELR